MSTNTNTTPQTTFRIVNDSGIFQMPNFAQMHEDPTAEFVAIGTAREPLDILCVCSAGDIALSILGQYQEFIQSIDLIDNNPIQLILTRIKIALAQIAPTIAYYVLYLMNPAAVPLDKLKETLLVGNIGPGAFKWFRTNLSHMVQNNMSLLQYGKYDQVWKGVAAGHQFNDDELALLFGHAAVQNGQNFQMRFDEIFQQLLAQSSDMLMYIINGNLPSKYVGKIFDYLHRDSCSNNICIRFLFMDIISYLKGLPDNKKYHHIFLSNITDWLSTEQRAELFEEAKKHLHATGNMVVRRFNSDFVLANALQENWSIKDLAAYESTLHYKEVLAISGKKSSKTE